jgi:hypothetical protein
VKPSVDRTADKEWRQLYENVIFEEDPLARAARAHAAETAIRHRVLELWRTDTAEALDARERLELHAALYFVQLLRSLQTHQTVPDNITPRYSGRGAPLVTGEETGDLRPASS